MTFGWVTLVPEIVALETVAAYRSGLDIDTHVTKEAAENGLVEVLQGKRHVWTCSMSLNIITLTVFFLQLESLSVLETKA